MPCLVSKPPWERGMQSSLELILLSGKMALKRVVPDTQYVGGYHLKAREVRQYNME